MDPKIKERLDSEPELKKKLIQLSEDYIKLGNQVLDYHASSFDVAYDIFNCFKPLTRKDVELKDKGAPRSWILPMTANQISTMTSFMAQALFGDQQPHKVEAREAKDELAADLMNQLLRWNDEKQQIFTLGLLFIQETLLTNRGVMYDSWVEEFDLVYREFDIETETTHEKTIDPDTGEEIIEEIPGERIQELRKVKIKTGGYNRIEVVSPYNFICDTALPSYRFQEGRFAGHRTYIPWNELKSRSIRPIESATYVLPEAIKKLKASQPASTTNSLAGMIAMNNSTPSANLNGITSRTQLERSNSNQGNNPYVAADKHDGGVVETYELWVKIIPADYELSDSTDPTIYRLLIGNRKELLSVDEAPNLHGEFPYSLAEARPSAQLQFSPSWALMLKPIQDQIDFLKDKHQEALARTVGNIFVARTQWINVEDFNDPEKIGLFINITDDAPMNLTVNDIVQQVPIQDMTASFYQEMNQLLAFSEQVTAATSGLQGANDGSGTATEFQSTQNMAAGRLSSVARIISEMALVPQTRRFVKNFQQFMSDDVVTRIHGDSLETRPQFRKMFPDGRVRINRDAIQGDFDLIAHDGTLPGTDAKKVAAATRALEVAQGLPQYFDPTKQGSIDLQSLFLETLKASGLQVDNYIIDKEEADEAAQKQAEASQGGISPDMIKVIVDLIKVAGDRNQDLVRPVLLQLMQMAGLPTPENAQQAPSSAGAIAMSTPAQQNSPQGLSGARNTVPGTEGLGGGVSLPEISLPSASPSNPYPA